MLILCLKVRMDAFSICYWVTMTEIRTLRLCLDYLLKMHPGDCPGINLMKSDICVLSPYCYLVLTGFIWQFRNYLPHPTKGREIRKWKRSDFCSNLQHALNINITKINRITVTADPQDKGQNLFFLCGASTFSHRICHWFFSQLHEIYFPFSSEMPATQPLAKVC